MRTCRKRILCWKPPDPVGEMLTSFRGINQRMRVRVFKFANFPETYSASEQSFGGWKQSYAISAILHWIVLRSVYLNASCARKINYTEAEIDSMTKQFGSRYNDTFNATTASAENQAAMRTATETITLKDVHYEIGLPWRDASMRLLDNHVNSTKTLNGLKRILRGQEFCTKYSNIIRRVT